MVKYLSSLSSVKSKVCVGKVAECNCASEDQQQWIVSIAKWVKWIISSLVAVWLIVDAGFLLKDMATWVSREDVLVMVHWQVIVMSVWVVKLDTSRGSGLHAIKGHSLPINWSNELM